MSISGKTRVCGVIGDPISHTLSPIIHNTAFSHLKLDFVYLAFDVKPSELENAMHGIRGLGIHGLNVTMPHKKAVLRFLDEVDQTVKFLGVVNTILNKKGRLCGFNTDGFGALRALKENGFDLSGKKALLLGAGGAAKVIALSLAEEVEELTLLNRTLEKVRKIEEKLNQHFGEKVRSDTLSPGNIKKYLRDSDILINATSVGMYPNLSQSIVPSEILKPDLVVMDIVYNPVETQLVENARTAGASVITGVEMLIHQGAASFEIWTGCPAPVDVMRKAALSELTSIGENR